MPVTQVQDLLWTTLTFTAMGCPVELQLQGDPALGGWARDEIERLEQSWSRFRDDSELCRLNRSNERAVEVSPTLMSAAAVCRTGVGGHAGRVRPDDFGVAVPPWV